LEKKNEKKEAGQWKVAVLVIIDGDVNSNCVKAAVKL